MLLSQQIQLLQKAKSRLDFHGLSIKSNAQKLVQASVFLKGFLTSDQTNNNVYTISQERKESGYTSIKYLGRLLPHKMVNKRRGKASQFAYTGLLMTKRQQHRSCMKVFASPPQMCHTFIRSFGPLQFKVLIHKNIEYYHIITITVCVLYQQQETLSHF